MLSGNPIAIRNSCPWTPKTIDENPGSWYSSVSFAPISLHARSIDSVEISKAYLQIIAVRCQLSIDLKFAVSF